MSSEGQSENPILGHVKDIRSVVVTTPNAKYRAQIEGHVWRTRKMGNLIFLDITDGTGAVQISCSRKTFGKESWEQIKNLHRANHIDVVGTVGITSKGYITVFAEQVAVRLAPGLTGPNATEIWDTGIAEEMSGLFTLARVRRVMQDMLRELNYDEIETPLLHRIVEQNTGLTPFVKFFGFGPSTPLATSPAPLLRRAILDGIHEVFAFSRIFSRDLRIGQTLYENFVLCARKADPEETEMAALGEDIIKATFNNFRTAPKENICPKNWVEIDTRWKRIEVDSSDSIPEYIDEPQIFVCLTKPDVEEQKESNQIKNPFWIYWPKSLCLAEGHVEIIDNFVQVGGLMLYLDNIVMVILGRANIYLHRASFSESM